jgi:ElaB/YqjD/DUF883 family membrane-anchored ribosome-binding protein
LTWQTISHLNKLELENSVLKESLSRQSQQMNALIVQQNLYCQKIDAALDSVRQFVNDCGEQVSRLSDSNRQLQSGIDRAMTRAADTLSHSTERALIQVESEVNRKSVAYITQMENAVKRALASFRHAEARLDDFTNRHFWLTVVVCCSVLGHLIGCIQWILTLL